MFEKDGRAVGAVELNGLTPRLWLPESDDDTRRAAFAAAFKEMEAFVAQRL